MGGVFRGFARRTGEKRIWPQMNTDEHGQKIRLDALVSSVFIRVHPWLNKNGFERSGLGELLWVGSRR
jgi:hypothetical protein